jgi:hypothetical protein
MENTVSGALLGVLRNRGAPPPSFYSWTRDVDVFDDNGNETSSVTATFNTNGTVSYTTSTGDLGGLSQNMSHWHDGGTVTGIGNSRWAKKTFVSGDATSGTLATTLTALSASRTIAIQTVASELREGVVLIEIYSDSGGVTKVGEISLTIGASP